VSYAFIPAPVGRIALGLRRMGGLLIDKFLLLFHDRRT